MVRITHKHKKKLKKIVEITQLQIFARILWNIFPGVIRTEAFASQPTLERIDLRYNRISQIEGGAFRDLSSPKEIYLAGNRLIQLNSDVFEVKFIHQKLYFFLIFTWTMFFLVETGCFIAGKTGFIGKFYYCISINCTTWSGQPETAQSFV